MPVEGTDEKARALLLPEHILGIEVKTSVATPPHEIPDRSNAFTASVMKSFRKGPIDITKKFDS